MPPVQINYPAVLAAAGATLLIGALWYSPGLFGRLWARAHGFQEDQLAELRRTVARIWLVSLLCYLVVALVLAMLVSYLGLSRAVEGLGLGFLLWLGFAATLGLTQSVFAGRGIAAYLIDTGYQLVYLLAMGALIAAWP